MRQKIRGKVQPRSVSKRFIYPEDDSEVVMEFLGVYLYKGLLAKTVLIDKPHCGIYIKWTNYNNKYTFQIMHQKEQCKLTTIQVPPLTLQTSLLL